MKSGHLLRLAGRPRGAPPRNPPIYYFWAAPPEHTANGKIKPQVDGLLFLRKEGYGRGVGVKRSKWLGSVMVVLRAVIPRCPKAAKATV